MKNPFDFSEAAKDLMSRREGLVYTAALSVVASEQLPVAAGAVGWKYIGKNEALHHWEFPRLLVIGVATWVPAELRALDALALGPVSDQVVIFDVDQIATQDGVVNLLPGSNGYWTRTPFLGEYENGASKRFLQGEEALQQLNAIAKSRF